MPTLTPDQTLRLLAEAYALPAPLTALTPVARGAVGRIWRADLPDGSRYAVKELFWGGSEASIEAEVAFRDRAVDAGVTAPASLRTVDGTYLWQVPGGPLVRLYSWVDGRPVEPAEPRSAEWLGQTLGRLHAVGLPVNGAPVDEWYSRPPDVTRWAELSEDGPLAADFRRSAARLVELTELVRPLDRDRLVFAHRDLYPSNVLVSAGDFVLLDWENAGLSDPSRELAGRLLGWHVHGTDVDAEGIRRTMRAYRDAGGQAELSGLDAFSLDLCSFLNYLEGQARGAVDSGLPAEERERCVAALTQHLRGVPRLATLRSVLAAARTA